MRKFDFKIIDSPSHAELNELGAAGFHIISIIAIKGDVSHIMRVYLQRLIATDDPNEALDYVELSGSDSPAAPVVLMRSISSKLLDKVELIIVDGTVGVNADTERSGHYRKLAYAVLEALGYEDNLDER